MRYLFTLLLVIIFFPASAIRLQLAYQGGWANDKVDERPFGPSVFAQRSNANGVGAYISTPVYKNLHLGFNAVLLTWRVNGDNILKYAQDKYEDPNYFVKQTNGIRDMKNGMFGLDLSYNLDLKYFDVEPFIRGGIAFASYAEQGLTVNRKRKNDNYSEDYSIKVRSKGYGYFGGGIKLHRKILKWLYIETGLSYTKGKASFDFAEEKTDFTGTIYPANHTKFIHPMNSTQFEVGVQFRLGRDMK